jgi:acetyl esterase/lipase
VDPLALTRDEFAARADPELAAYIPRLPRLGLDDLTSARRTATLLGEGTATFPGQERLVIDEREIPSDDGDRVVRVRVYAWPDDRSDRPCIVFMHGGAFVMGSLDTHHDMAVRGALAADAVVCSVDYRLAPEHPFPAGLVDCHAALDWVTSRPAELGIDPLRVAVAGISAGAGLAAALALFERDRGGPAICHQWLAQPLLDDRPNSDSRRKFVEDPLFDAASCRIAWEHYLRGSTAPGSPDVSPYAAPARAESLEGLPPASIYVGELDSLRDDGIAYATRLLEADVPVELQVYPGTFHGSQRIARAAVSQRMLADWDDGLRRAVAPRHG